MVTIGQKNHNIPAYIDAALRAYNLGLPLNNNEFIRVVNFLRAQKMEVIE
jgi:hypothetical protein